MGGEISDLQEKFVQAIEVGVFDRAVEDGQILARPGATYEQVVPEHIRDFAHMKWHMILNPVWESLIAPALEAAGVEQAAVLRARIEMFIHDLQGRGDAVIAAELQVIIDQPMED